MTASRHAGKLSTVVELQPLLEIGSRLGVVTPTRKLQFVNPSGD